MNEIQFANCELQDARTGAAMPGAGVSSQLASRNSQLNVSPIVSSHPITIRPGAMEDLPFIDSLQKKHSRELGFLPTKALEGKIRLGQVLVAWVTGNDEAGTMNDEKEGSDSSAIAHRSSFSHAARVGYLIAADRYSKRDEIGYVTQISVVPEYRRSLVAGMLLQAQFDRSAYGCRLYCCWCAQDLAANAFWEAMGFTAIAFRTGSKSRGSGSGVRGSGKTSLDSSPNPSTRTLNPRIHIFWQKRIRANDTTTPWWYPSRTEGGEMREDRLVFPIMPGVRWQDVKPIKLPEQDNQLNHEVAKDATTHDGHTVAGACASRPRGEKKAKSKAVGQMPKPMVGAHVRHGFRFAPPTPVATVEVEKPKLVKVAKEKAKIDPRLIAMSRELRDKWSEQVAPMIEENAAKHDVRKLVQSHAAETGPKLLAA